MHPNHDASADECRAEGADSSAGQHLPRGLETRLSRRLGNSRGIYLAGCQVARWVPGTVNGAHAGLYRYRQRGMCCGVLACMRDRKGTGATVSTVGDEDVDLLSGQFPCVPKCSLAREAAHLVATRTGGWGSGSPARWILGWWARKVGYPVMDRVSCKQGGLVTGTEA